MTQALWTTEMRLAIDRSKPENLGKMEPVHSHHQRSWPNQMNLVTTHGLQELLE